MLLLFSSVDKKHKEEKNTNLFYKKIIKKLRDPTTGAILKIEPREKGEKVENIEKGQTTGEKIIAGKKNVKYTIKGFVNTSMSYCNNDIKNATYDGTEEVTNKKAIHIKKLNTKNPKKKKLSSHSCPGLLDDEKINQVFNDNLQLDYSHFESKTNLSKYVDRDAKILDKVDFVIKENNIYNKNKVKEVSNTSNRNPKENLIKLSPINFIPNIISHKIPTQGNQDESIENYSNTTTTLSTFNQVKSTYENKTTK